MLFGKKARSPYSADPDVQRMLALQKGDRDAFDDLMRKHYPRILNFAHLKALQTCLHRGFCLHIFYLQNPSRAPISYRYIDFIDV
jgi:hypothetical protein